MKKIDVNTGDPVMFKRTEDGIETNIPHEMIYHSPDGFEWGYGGSGPADFALNILFAFTNDEMFSRDMHQEFKWFFIAGAPKEGGEIKNSDIRTWITDKLKSYDPRNR